MENKNLTEIHRVTKNNNYSVIHNQVLRRDDLSWKAKGIMAYILSLPDDWKIYLEEVAKHATDGKDSFRSGWNELKEVGYVDRIAIREKGKIVSWRTIIKENVDMKPFSPHSGFPEVDKPEVAQPDVANPKLLSTNELSTDKQSTDKRCSSAKLTEDFEKLWTLYPNKQGKKKAFAAYCKAIKSGDTNKAIQNGIVAYKKHLAANDWLKPAHGSTWFVNERWNDEYSDVGTVGKKVDNAWERQMEELM